MEDHEIARLLPLTGLSGGRRGRHCPDLDRWAGYVEAAVDAAERERLESHLADCAFCLGEVGFLIRAADLGPSPSVPTHLLDAARSARPRLLFGLRPAAVTLAWGTALAVTLLVLQPQADFLPRFESGSLPERPVRSSGATVDQPAASRSVAAALAPFLLQPAEGELVAVGSFELHWQEVPETLFYTVQLMNPRGDLVWEASAEGTSCAVPASAGLVSGQPLFAWVVAHQRSGAAVRSPVVSFRVAPN